MDYGADVYYHELAELALEGWDRWNAEWSRPPYHQDGLLVLSRDEMAPGGFEHESRRVLRERGYPTRRVNAQDRSQRFPAWSGDAHSDGYYNARAGWAESGAVVQELLALGAEAGVRRLTAAMGSLLEVDSRVTGVRTPEGEELQADRVVVCAGAWTPVLLPWLADLLHTVAQPVLHFRVEDPVRFSGTAFPPWAADIAGSGWYGFPSLPNGHVKIGHHGPGRPVRPDERGTVPEEHVASARRFLREAIPTLADAPLVGRRVCLYCDSSDGDFLIAEDPDRPGLVVASGGSGHAFKFAPILGSLVADAVEGRRSRWSDRFGWRQRSEGRGEAARYSGR
jgi:glycine/D-amino acid oxidase-like deaminating enzyme